MTEHPPGDWRTVLAEALNAPSFRELAEFVAVERQTQVVYPPPAEVFAALRLTPFAQVKAVVLGQDPYHGPGQAHGLAFSVRPGVPVPPSLRNIFRELREDLVMPSPDHGCLIPWAQQGVLLLNTVLTVRAGVANSHRGQGWEEFTDAVIRAVNAKPEPVVFLLWGGPAQRKARLITGAGHTVLTAAHPSPLSARQGFFGSRPFSRCNAALVAAGRRPINWELPPEPALRQPGLF